MIDITNEKDALFSEDRKYRYVLWRRIKDEAGLFFRGEENVELPHIMFIGLNPSTANENEDDPTIRRVVRFAKDWGYGGVYMMNLFAYVTAYPEELKKCSDPIGENNIWLEKIKARCSDILFAWGNFKEAAARAEEVMKMFPKAVCLGVNKNGTPKHPLYISAQQPRLEFNFSGIVK